MFTRDEANSFLAGCKARMQALVDATKDEARSDGRLTEAEQAEWDTIARWVEDTNSDLARLAQMEAIEAGTAPGVVSPGSGLQIQRAAEDPFDLSTLPLTATRGELRARATTALESVRGLDDASRAKAVELVERSDNRRGDVARHILATGTDAYRSAFTKLLAGEDYALSSEERHAVASARAASLTPGAGGYAVPFVVDPTIINTGTQATNPIRQIARVESITTDKWRGISSAGVTAAWAAEAAEVADGAPTLVQPVITAHKAHCFVPFSIEVGQDWASIEADIREMIAFEKDDLEGTAFAVGAGDGSNQPVGIVTALDGTTSEIAPITPETFAIGDVYKVETALAHRHRANASWLANKGTYNAIRQFDTTGGSALWERIGAAQPPELVGYNAYEASAMKSSTAMNVAATADNFLMVLGDFRNYVIVDRIGMSVELIPHLFATANNLPSGQRGFYAHWRVGGDSVNDGAFAMLSIPTAA